jgi:hypothetical protein
VSGEPPPHSDAHRRKVFYEAPVTKWLKPGPSVDSATKVLEWVTGCQLIGPPADATDLGSDFYLAEVPGTRTTRRLVRYLTVVYEQLIVVKEVR